MKKELKKKCQILGNKKINIKGKKKNLNFKISLFEFKRIVAIGVVESIDRLVICLTFMTQFLREVTLHQ